MDFKAITRRVLRKEQKLRPPLSKDGMYLIQGSWMYLDDRDSLNLSKNGIYEIEDTQFVREFVKSTDTAVDIGANIGYYTLMMARQAKHVYAFEPEPTNFEILKKNIDLNGLNDRVTLYQKGAAATADTVSFYLCDFNRGMHRLSKSQHCSEEIQIETIAVGDIIQDADFIKIDIEGAELGALLGMQELLSKKTTIMMEFHPDAIREYGVNPYDLYNFVLKRGYRILLHGKEVKDYSYLEDEALRRVGTNILCIKN